eukprot:CAMPEP_0206141402 /NCGR_PEP_ID=MMETSP1473-20131121/12794_1 /ASSEMBLY_ACC=CAM_ASM_001109 /TAXON_ID=1461547 /ORGANISM="Stichococcus sp, Strain RCC1054" /LENGTH=1079 /DNA_ID=CAMNT_0053535961 /DNA_START=148 /DNA_END=3387 /DNA_ORIENTATION=+
MGDNADANKAAAAPADEAELTPEQQAKKAAKAAKAAEKAVKAAKAKARLAEQKVQLASAGTSDKKKKAAAASEAKQKEEAEELASALRAAEATPKGKKKDTTAAMPRSYHPPAVEAAWYDWWEQQGYFKPREGATEEPFVMVIPPPNVTGSLHLGHALTNAIQDTVMRWRRMCGRDTLWVPGNDHAGIATQTVVEKALKRERGLSRHDLGREEFLKEVYKWVEKYGGSINGQLRRLGSSLDWSRSVFTMDEKLSAAVLEAFLRMHERGLIYRDNRLVNWDCALRTAVSDIEVEDTEVAANTMLSVPGYKDKVEFGVMKEFAYPLEDGGGELVVATTRIETMLGDTAVAIHPEDDRYKHLHGKFLIHPVDGRRIPIICDAETVDMTLGTGAVKITPAHDAKDFATGKRNNLEFINILNDDGTLNANCGKYAGKPRYEVRILIEEFLTSKGLFRGTTGKDMVLGICTRSNDVIEPLMRPQWWVNCSNMAARAKAACAPSPQEAVKGESFGIRPPAAQRDWNRWLSNIRDWCISRQLWWGHRIPAFYVRLEGEDERAPGGADEMMDRWVVAKDEAAARAKAEERFPGTTISLSQDEDVLDTWFSSGLFPFSVFGWPTQSADLERFFPGALLETGKDILFFWVARMVMMSLSLTDKVPFEQVYLHSMVRDAHGQKMSKSLGNALDPVDAIEGISLAQLHAKLEAGNLDPRDLKKAKAAQKADFPDGIEQCGTDALRFALVSYTSQGGDINLNIKEVVAKRHWCNKLWNAIKFALLNLGDNFVPTPTHEAAGREFADRWVLSRLKATITSLAEQLEDYDFGNATQALYSFWKEDLCDVFIELSKGVLGSPEGGDPAVLQATRDTLWLCLDTGLRLLHPFMPFVTEELWQRLPRGASEGAAAPPASIMIAPYPRPADAGTEDWHNPEVEAHMKLAQNVVTKLLSLKSDSGVATKIKLKAYLAATDASRGALQATSDAIAVLAFCSSVTILQEGESPSGDTGVEVIDATTTAYIDLTGLVDPKKQAVKLEKRAAELKKQLEAVAERVALPAYSKTPPEFVEADNQKRATLAANLASVEEELRRCTL